MCSKIGCSSPAKKDDSAYGLPSREIIAQISVRKSGTQVLDMGYPWSSSNGSRQSRELRVIADASVGISFRVPRALSVSDQMIRILLHFQDRQRKKEV